MAQNKSNLPATLYSLGVIIAIIVGAGAAIHASWADNAWLSIVLVVIGLIVGFYNITQKVVTSFLIGTISLIVARTAANLSVLDFLVSGVRIGTFLTSTIEAFLMVVGAAAVVVAFRAVYGLAK